MNLKTLKNSLVKEKFVVKNVLKTFKRKIETQNFGTVKKNLVLNKK